MRSKVKGDLITFVLIMLGLAVVFGGIGTGVSAHYGYSAGVRQYLNLADDASDAPTKLQYLQEYRQAVLDNVHRNDARYWFKQRQYTRDIQVQILDTLLGWLQAMTQMDPRSTEYQFAMQQVTGQEFDHVLARIDGIFYACYCRESLWRWVWTCGTARRTSSK
jgi:hypothetical protein